MATIVGRVRHRWTVLNTRDGGQRWVSVRLSQVSSPAGVGVSGLYRFQHDVWLLVGSHLYEGPNDAAQGWRRVPQPKSQGG